MLNSSKITIQSEQFPGVSYTLRRMTVKRRQSYNQSVRDLSRRMLRLIEEISALEQTDDVKSYVAKVVAWTKGEGPLPVPTGDADKFVALRDEFSDIDSGELVAARLKWGLDSITGYEVDGNSAPDADFLMEHGDESLVREIAAAIDHHKDLSAEESKNSQPLSTSGDPVETALQPSTAQTVSA